VRCGCRHAPRADPGGPRAARSRPLTPEGGRRLCTRVDAGRPIAHVAAEAGISRQCLSKWHGRWEQDGEDGLLDPSSQPVARRKVIKLHCPWTNGKAERLNQTANDERARATLDDSSAHRTAALAPWLHEDNHHRPHAALRGLPPVSRLTNVPGCDT
jgi:transposase-like protein